MESRRGSFIHVYNMFFPLLLHFCYTYSTVEQAETRAYGPHDLGCAARRIAERMGRTMRSPMLGIIFLALPSLAALADPLVAFRVDGGKAIPDSLTGKPGDPTLGARVAASRTLGNCLACHALPMPEEKLQGDVGPDLRGVASRLSAGELRLRVVNPKLVDPQTAMPAYYRVDGLYRVRRDLVGKPILTAAQVEDVVAYLATLTE